LRFAEQLAEALFGERLRELLGETQRSVAELTGLKQAPISSEGP